VTLGRTIDRSHFRYDAIAQRAVDAVYAQYPNGATGRQPRQCATEARVARESQSNGKLLAKPPQRLYLKSLDFSPLR
jgi:hypothetical protein